MIHELTVNDDCTSPILPGLEDLWTEAAEIWDELENRGDFFNFVAADYEAVYHALVGLQGQVETVLEWGSGLGVISIMAARLGFDAYGIEIEPELIDLSSGLAEKYGGDVRFAAGSYVPNDYRLNPELIDGDFRTSLDDRDAYDALDMELRDFDLVYMFPWPNELALHQDIMRQCGGRDGLFLTFDAREGLSLMRPSRG